MHAGEWQSPDTVANARALLGKFLVRRFDDGGEMVRAITEVEAYDGEKDLACHACRGRTKRTKVMYGAGGVWYVYLCYGIHEMLNLVTGPEGYPAAVLIRGVEGLTGPGRLTKGLGIGRALNEQMAAPGTGLWIEDRGRVVRPQEVQVTPRIGVDYAGPVWSQMPWRLVLGGAAETGRRRGADKK